MSDENTKPTDEPDALPDTDEPETSAPDLADTEDGDQPVTDTSENDQPQEGGQ